MKLLTALVTPFSSDSPSWRDATALDLTSFKHLIQRQAAAGVDGIVVNGTTGENILLSDKEQKTIIDTAIEASPSELEVWVGCSHIATNQALEFIQWVNTRPGIQGVMIATPPQVKPCQDGLFWHFSKLATASQFPVMIYNNPGRSVTGLSAHTIGRLARHPNIVSLKEASGSWQFMVEVLQTLQQVVPKKKKFDVFSGDDPGFFTCSQLKIAGLISVASNLAPRALVHYLKVLNQDKKQRYKAILQLAPLLRSLFMETNPVPVKAALAMLGLCKPDVRSPLSPLNQTSTALLRKTIETFIDSTALKTDWKTYA
jgi:4-hydroxy-tetrahydrodipicolinate synthase